MNEPGKGQAVWRGATKRCARCGERKLFNWWASMVERCPRCGHKFERADGFWLGSIMMNMTFTFLLFLVVFFGGLALTWGDTPWLGLLLGTMALNLLFPILFHPVSRTLWVGMEMAVRPLEPQEIVDAAAFGTGEWSLAGLGGEPARDG